MPPKFDDIAKSVKDLFEDDFDAGKVNLTLKSKATNGVAVKVKLDKDNAKNTAKAKLESTYTNSAGISFKEVWESSNQVTTEVSMKNVLMKGTKFVGEAKFSPTTGMAGNTIKVDYGAPNFYINTKLADLKSLTAATCFSVNKFLVGGSAKFSDKGFGGYSAGVSFVDADMVVSSSINDKNSVTGSIFHSPKPNLDAGVRFSYNRGSNNTTFAIAGAYEMDASTSLKAALDKDMALSLAYSQTLRKGVKLGLSADVQVAKLNEDGHSLGLTFELSA